MIEVKLRFTKYLAKSLRLLRLLIAQVLSVQLDLVMTDEAGNVLARETLSFEP